MLIRKTILFLLLANPLVAIASVPRSCDGSDAERKEMLVLIAASASDYYQKKGKLPAIWSTEMSALVSKVPNANKFGNINPSSDGAGIEMVCSILGKKGEYSKHHEYHISMNTFEITDSVKEVRKVNK